MSVMTYHLDWDNLKEIANLGIRRASVFMGIGTNAAHQMPRVSHVLEDAQFTVVPAEVSNETADQFADTFEQWVVANGFREIVETFSVFLAEVFRAAYLFQQSPNATQSGLALATKKFDHEGVEEQFRKLCEMLSIDARFIPMFASLKYARNCMAHRRGIIGPKDLPAPGVPFTLEWRTRTFRLENGVDVSLALSRGEEVRVEKDQVISFGEVDRSKSFALGHAIRLSQHELNEICFGATIATEVVMNGLTELARSKGAVVNMVATETTDRA